MLIQKYLQPITFVALNIGLGLFVLIILALWMVQINTASDAYYYAQADADAKVLHGIWSIEQALDYIAGPRNHLLEIICVPPLSIIGIVLLFRQRKKLF